MGVGDRSWVSGSCSPSRLQDAPQSKSSPTGQPRRSRAWFLNERLMLPATPLVAGVLLLQMFQGTCFCLRAGLAQPPRVQLAVWPPVQPSGHTRQAGVRPRRRQGQAALLRVPPRQRGLQAHRGPGQCGTPPTPRSQPAGQKQLQQGTEDGRTDGRRRSPRTLPQRLHSALTASHTCRLTRGRCTPSHACTPRTHAGSGTRCPDPHAGTRTKSTRMLPAILTWLASWLPPGRKEQRRQGCRGGARGSHGGGRAQTGEGVERGGGELPAGPEAYAAALSAGPRYPMLCKQEGCPRLSVFKDSVGMTPPAAWLQARREAGPAAAAKGPGPSWPDSSSRPPGVMGGPGSAP